MTGFKFSFSAVGGYCSVNCVTTTAPSLRYMKNGPFLASFSFIFVFPNKTLQFLQEINVKNVHPVYSAGIRTHDLRKMSLLR